MPRAYRSDRASTRPRRSASGEVYWISRPLDSSWRDRSDSRTVSPKSATDNTGVVDHIAFLATEPEKFNARFETLGLAARKRYFPEFQLFQMFVRDPDGLTIELNFHGIAEEPSWGGGSENYAEMPRATASNKPSKKKAAKAKVAA